MSVKKILVLHGPNLNMLGNRDPEQYGTQTLTDLEDCIQSKAPDLSFSFFQSNHEGELIERIHQEVGENEHDGLILNLGAFTHTSVAIRDALEMVSATKVEVHLSNIHARESFRHTSFSGGVCKGIISGFGFQGYDFAIQAIMNGEE